MNFYEECAREALVAFGPILLAVLAFGLFRFWQVFLRKPRKEARDED
jgi:hypothetical protein